MTRGIGQARDKEDGYEISLELADFFRAFNRRDSLFPSYLSLSLSRARANFSELFREPLPRCHNNIKGEETCRFAVPRKYVVSTRVTASRTQQQRAWILRPLCRPPQIRAINITSALCSSQHAARQRLGQDVCMYE
jgi:hypothetical protein